MHNLWLLSQDRRDTSPRGMLEVMDTRRAHALVRPGHATRPDLFRSELPQEPQGLALETGCLQCQQSQSGLRGRMVVVRQLQRALDGPRRNKAARLP